MALFSDGMDVLADNELTSVSVIEECMELGMLDNEFDLGQNGSRGTSKATQNCRITIRILRQTLQDPDQRRKVLHT